jgi:hypothetical protein
VPWSVLAERESTDAAVQEAKLALPYAYGQLDVYSRAALMYARLSTRSAELKKLDASMQSIRQGQFLKALVREEISQDKDWVIRLRSLPESPETYYLMELMAVARLPDGAAELSGPRRPAPDGLVARELRCLRRHHRSLRRQYYEPAAAPVDAQFRELDSRMRLRLEQHRP